MSQYMNDLFGSFSVYPGVGLVIDMLGMAIAFGIAILILRWWFSFERQRERNETRRRLLERRNDSLK